MSIYSETYLDNLLSTKLIHDFQNKLSYTCFFLVKHAYKVYIAGTCFSTELQYCHQLHIKIQKRTCSQERKQNKTNQNIVRTPGANQ